MARGKKLPCPRCAWPGSGSAHSAIPSARKQHKHSLAGIEGGRGMAPAARPASRETASSASLKLVLKSSTRCAL